MSYRIQLCSEAGNEQKRYACKTRRHHRPHRWCDRLCTDYATLGLQRVSCAIDVYRFRPFRKNHRNNLPNCGFAQRAARMGSRQRSHEQRSAAAGIPLPFYRIVLRVGYRDLVHRQRNNCRHRIALFARSLLFRLVPVSTKNPQRFGIYGRTTDRRNPKPIIN